MTSVIQTPVYKTKSDEDFPALGAMAPTKAKRSSSTPKVKKFGKGRKLELKDLGFTSRMDQLKENRYRRRGHGHGHGQRSAAYEQLQNKEGMAERLTKTRLCWSVEKGVACPHGKDKCKFAHSLDELRMSPCVFGGHCRFVQLHGISNYKNCGDRVCQYLHPDECQASFMSRTGYDKIKIKEVPKPTTKTTTKTTDFVPSQVKVNAWSRPRMKIQLDDENVQKTDKKRVRFDDEKKEDASSKEEEDGMHEDTSEIEDTHEDEDEDLLEEQLDEILGKTNDDHFTSTVPKVLAVQTLEAALEAGHTKITITII